MWDLRNSTRPIMSVVASPTEVLVSVIFKCSFLKTLTEYIIESH